MDIPNIIDDINSQNGLKISLEQKFKIGEQGAYQVSDLTGKKYVLKIDKGNKTKQLNKTKSALSLLKEKSYPVTDYVVIGLTNDYTYSLQTKLPGKPFRTLNKDLLEHILELNKLQQDIPFEDNQDWSDKIIKAVLVGEDNYCCLNSLENCSDETRNILNILQVAVKGQKIKFIKGDIVHFDFSGANILVENNKVTGVIDWAGVCSGDCTFDLVELLFYHYFETEFRKMLLNTILNRIDKQVLKAYLAHMIIRQIDWSIRFHNEEAVGRYVLLSQKIIDNLFRN